MSVLATLINLSRSPQPPTWIAAGVPWIERYVAADMKLRGAISDLSDLADDLSLLSPSALATKVTKEAQPHVGALVALGRDLRSVLDSRFDDARGAVRGMVTASKEHEFQSALESAEKYIPRAEGTVAKIERTLADINAAIHALADLTVESPAYVLPERPAGMIQEVSK